MKCPNQTTNHQGQDNIKEIQNYQEELYKQQPNSERN